MHYDVSDDHLEVVGMLAIEMRRWAGEIRGRVLGSVHVGIVIPEGS